MPALLRWRGTAPGRWSREEGAVERMLLGEAARVGNRGGEGGAAASRVGGVVATSNGIATSCGGGGADGAQQRSLAGSGSGGGCGDRHFGRGGSDGEATLREGWRRDGERGRVGESIFFFV